MTTPTPDELDRAMLETPMARDLTTEIQSTTPSPRSPSGSNLTAAQRIIIAAVKGPPQPPPPPVIRAIKKPPAPRPRRKPTPSRIQRFRSRLGAIIAGKK